MYLFQGKRRAFSLSAETSWVLFIGKYPFPQGGQIQTDVIEGENRRGREKLRKLDKKGREKIRSKW